MLDRESCLFGSILVGRDLGGGNMVAGGGVGSTVVDIGVLRKGNRGAVAS